MTHTLDWIFTNGKEVLSNPDGEAVAMLAECFGVSNLWGKNGEGFVYASNLRATLQFAAPYLLSGDKNGYLKACDEAVKEAK